jgi:protein SCO1/2
VRWIALLLSLSASAVPVSSIYQLPGQWRDDAARELALTQFNGRWVVATLAYAHCPGVCSMTAENLKKVEQELGPAAGKIDFILFSIDPRQESAEDMHDFLARKKLTGEHWHFLSGQSANVRKVATALDMAFGEKSARGAHIMHTFKFALISPDGRVLHTTDAMQVHEFAQKTRAALVK